MEIRTSLALIVFFASVVFGQGGGTKGPKKKELVPAGYKKDDLRGFTLYFSDEVLKQDRDSKLERKPLEALERELIIVETVLPVDKVKNLKAVPIWVEWDEHIAMNNGRRGQAVAVFYGGHQSNLLGRDSNPLKANSVTILSLKSLTAEHQPKTDSGRCVTLHELAHAFHILTVGSENPIVNAAYKQAMERKLYDPALYVATNEKEYFAELTCAYLEKLDYFPRTRDELKKHDPKGYEMLEKFWGRAPERKVGGVAAKGPKLPSADGDGKFPLTASTSMLKFGPPLFSEVAPKESWKGRPILVLMFPATSGRSLALLPKFEAWHSELQDFGLIVVAAESKGISAEEAKQIARERNITFPITSDVDFGPTDSFALPHALLFDHTGKCVFRGAPLDAEPYTRIATGKALIEGLEKSAFDKSAQPVVDLLENGAPISQVLAKLEQQLRVTKKEAATDLNVLDAALTSGGKKIFDAAVEKSKTDPVGAFFDAERLPTFYRGTSLEKPTFTFVNKLKGNPKVELETRARASLAAIKKIDTQLSGRDMSFNPKSLDFKDSNSFLLKQLADAVEKLRKSFPNTRAADDALKFAERWDVKVKS